MTLVGKSVQIVQPPRLLGLDLTGGDVAIAVTTSPFEDVPSPIMYCFVVLRGLERLTEVTPGDALDDAVNDPHAVMIITCLPMPDPPGKRVVNLVFAVPGFRCERSVSDPSVRAAVAVGRHLFASGGLTHHSEDRNEAGDRWAREVGGELPRREAPGVAYDSTATGSAIVAMLNSMQWPAFEPGGG